MLTAFVLPSPVCFKKCPCEARRRDCPAFLTGIDSVKLRINFFAVKHGKFLHSFRLCFDKGLRSIKVTPQRSPLLIAVPKLPGVKGVIRFTEPAPQQSVCRIFYRPESGPARKYNPAARRAHLQPCFEIMRIVSLSVKMLCD